ncbi:FolC bifunctional protein [Hypoxylon sp. NC1633]|nr:FolC bifunctional protein [Hypoxylon sp. NC1633]
MAAYSTSTRASPVTRLLRLTHSYPRLYLNHFPITSLRPSSTMARTYESALRHLDSIQSNRAVTSLFSPPPPTPTPTPTPSAPATSTAQDLNAQAIPEMITWLGRAGITQDDLARQLNCIHVAGTKGKGSVCAFLTGILTQPDVAPVAGRVGTYTSPHLVSVRERIQLDGRPISAALFARYFFEVWDALTAAARIEAAAAAAASSGSSPDDAELEGPASKPFYFRFLTILALHVFLREGVRSAVIECGIGGEYDSTNVLPAAAVTGAVVAQLGIDHVGMLGDTLPEIAWNKAGVCKPGRRCFTRELTEGDAARAAMRVLRSRAAEKKALLVEVKDEDVERWGGVLGNERESLEGAFQKYNQALAVRAADEHLRVLSGELGARTGADETLDVLGARFADGLRAARLRGRCETREDGEVTWYIDGAHTAESLEEAARWFAGKLRALANNTKVVLLFNQQERDVAGLLRSLFKGIERGDEDVLPETVFDGAIFTRNDLQRKAADEPERDLSVQDAAGDAMLDLSPQTVATVLDNVGEAVESIRATSRAHGTKVAVLATGSLYLVGSLHRTLEPDADL